MKRPPKQSLPLVAVAGVTAWFVALAVREPPRDGDPYWQRWLGERILQQHAIPRTLGSETFTASGAPWTPQEWAYSTLLAVTQDHGVASLMPAICGLAAGAALLATVRRCARRGVPEAYTVAAVVICMLAMLQSFGARPQVIGWAGAAMILWLLEAGGRSAWWCIT